MIFDTRRMKVEIFENGNFPQELLALRKEIYVEETGYLKDGHLIDENDKKGIHICIYYEGEIVAAAHAVNAEDSDFSKYSGVSKKDLKTFVYVSRQMVKKEFRGCGLSKLMIYLEGHYFRMRGRKTIIVYMTDGEAPNRRILNMQDMQGARPRKVKDRHGKTYMVYGAGQDIDYGNLRCFNLMSPDLQKWVGENLIPKEAISTVEMKIAEFYSNKWFGLVKEGRLSRRQYLVTLGNWHQFVRWTTRILARIISVTEDSKLRRHYIQHLKGEIDHEKWIESDINHIEGDVDYVTKFMVPIKEIRIFMAMQESLTSFYQDPVVFLGIPFAIEGLSGKLPHEFAVALKKNVESWGYSNPQKATTFLASHTHTDGAEDGHWQKTKETIQKYLRTEKDLQAFLVTADIVISTINAAFETFVENPDFTIVGKSS